MRFRRLGILVVSLSLAPGVLQSENLVEAYRYGNWCGANHPENPSEDQRPIDKVDALCKKHDLAYAAEGQMSGDADAELVRDLIYLMNSGDLEDDQVTEAALIAVYMTGQQHVVSRLEQLPDGKASTALNAALATVEASVVLPHSVAAEAMEEVSEKVGGLGGKVMELYIVKPLRVPGMVMAVGGTIGTEVLGAGSSVWKGTKKLVKESVKSVKRCFGLC